MDRLRGLARTTMAATPLLGILARAMIEATETAAMVTLEMRTLEREARALERLTLEARVTTAPLVDAIRSLRFRR